MKGYRHPTAIIGEPPQHRDWRNQEHFPPDVDDAAEIRAYCVIDSGFQRRTKIGASMLMAHVHVGHDVVIGDGCEVAPMTSIGGHVMIGDGVRIGQGATFKPGVKVGDGARIGMGAVVIRDVPAGEIWAGNPAESLKPRAVVGGVHALKLPA